jgi:uncharacterized membrane protein SpoIIM required for sporulation
LRFKISKRRLLYLAFGVAAFLIAYSAGAGVPLSDEEAAQVRNEFSDQIKDIDQSGIFLNNLRIDLIMFIPALGACFGAFSGFQTGAVFSALASSNPVVDETQPLLIFALPFGVMELFAYGLAMSRSGMLIYQLVKKRPWREYAIPSLIELGVAAAVLFAAAAVEWWFIQQLGGLHTSIVIEPV